MRYFDREKNGPSREDERMSLQKAHMREGGKARAEKDSRGESTCFHREHLVRRKGVPH